MNTSGEVAQTSGQTSPLRVGGILLAAGAGSRMGHQPKCLLQLDGESVLIGQLNALAQAGVTPRWVVLGHHAQRIEQALSLSPVAVRSMRNPQADDGHVSSLRVGLRALPPGLDAVMVVLTDQPLINTQDVRDLLTAFASRAQGTEMLQPYVDNLPGNPVVFSASVAQQILASDARFGAKQWQQAHPQGIDRWQTPNAHYRIDVDSEEDRLALEALTGRRLRWPDGLNDGPGV